MAITLPQLPYDYSALEPVISAATLKAHHGAHHRGYVEKLNTLIKGRDLEGASLETIVRRNAWAATAGTYARAVFNNAAQAWNHAFYWKSLAPKGQGGRPKGALAERIKADFGGTEQFAELFKVAAGGVFGSGWAWLVLDGGMLRIACTKDADSPWAHGQTPLLALDVWEHAYYLDHQWRRADYVEGIVDQLLNWEFAARNFALEEALHA